MATSPTNSPPTTSSQTKSTRPDDQPDEARTRPNGQRSDPNGQRDDEAAARVVEPMRAAAVQTVEAVQGVVGQSQDRALRSAVMWTEMLTRLNPFALLSPFVAGSREGDPRADEQPRVGAPEFPVRAWADGVFDIFETALANQRRTVDHILATQRQLVGQLLDTGAGIAAAQAETARDHTSARATRG